jgi:hypothetical protein
MIDLGKSISFLTDGALGTKFFIKAISPQATIGLDAPRRFVGVYTIYNKLLIDLFENISSNAAATIKKPDVCLAFESNQP